MNYINLENVNTKDKKYIGSGRTARCYLLKDGSVLKIFKNNYDALSVLEKDMFNKNTDILTNMSNNTFVGPKKLVMENNFVIGYLYSYVNGKTINKINNDTKLRDIFRSYNQVINDVKDITNKSIYLRDTNYDNIIYDNCSIHIIDLDYSFFSENKNKDILLYTNSKEVFTNVVGGLFGKRYNEILSFDNQDLDNTYSKVNYNNTDSINNFVDHLAYCCRDDNPTVKTVKKKIKVTRDLDCYHM